MKLILTHAYFLEEDERERKIMKPYPPLGILSISAYLSENGLEHRVIDTTFSNQKTFFSQLEKEQPDIIGIYCNLMTKVNVVAMMQRIRNTDSLKHMKVILGGPDVTYNIEDYLNAGADFIVIGEGEESFLELVNHLMVSGDDPDAIHGLAFKKNKKVFRTNARNLKKEIDALPVPNRKAIDMQPYLQAWKNNHGKSMISVSTQRGCPYTCKWCSTAVYGQSYRRRSPVKVVEEMKMLQEVYHPDALWFVDDVFTVSHKWLEAFRDELKKQQVRIPFECITRADRLNADVMSVLKDAGCFRVWIGAESGSQKILDAMDRRVQTGQVQDMIQLAKKYGIETGTFIMIGYPGETMHDIEATIDHLVRADPDHFTITVTYPIKGTSLYEEVKDLQTKKIDWPTQTDRQRDFKRTYSRKFYDYATRMVVNEVGMKKPTNSGPVLKAKLKSKVLRALMQWERLVNRVAT